MSRLRVIIREEIEKFIEEKQVESYMVPDSKSDPQSQSKPVNFQQQNSASESDKQ